MNSKEIHHPSLIPEYIKNLKIYEAGKPIEELAREKNLTKISKLASNENPLGPSPFAIREMTQGLWDLHRYPDMHAFQLKNALADHYRLKMGNIVLGNGSEGIMAYIARTFLQPGDTVLTSECSFIGFYILAQGVGAHLTKVPLTHDYRYDVEAMAKAVTAKTKIVYIANPNNPTGTYITRKEFDFLMESIPDYCLVILDEAYFEFAQDLPDYPDSMDYRYDNVITLRTFSKAYGLAGIRIGYGFAHDYLISHLNKIRLPFEPNFTAQRGAFGALKDQPHLERTLQNNKIQYQKAFNYLFKEGLDPIPSSTNFISFSTETSEGSDWLFQNLLNHGVIIRPLKSNGMPNFLRISLGTEEEMLHFYEAMDKLIPLYDKSFRRRIS